MASDSNQKITIPLTDIAEPGTRSFRLQTSRGEREGFIVRYAGEIRAYINSCPHTGVTLNWSEEQFFDLEFKFLQCSMHGALFEPLNGLCVWGPCVGERLTPFPISLVDEHVIIYS